MAGKTGIIGYYNEHGYYVSRMTDGNVEDELYRAGNSRWESTDVVDPKDETNALPLAEIKAFCIQTSKEMAEEEGIGYIGVDYDESDDEDFD